ncbi:hypothetical protein A2U01_0085816, partial [Trifolium medium]|nr:hypothetical protein [Trifolium medium]
SPEQEPPKSLLLGIGVMTLGSSSFVQEDFLVIFRCARGRIYDLLLIICNIPTRRCSLGFRVWNAMTHHVHEEMLACFARVR